MMIGVVAIYYIASWWGGCCCGVRHGAFLLFLQNVE